MPAGSHNNSHRSDRLVRHITLLFCAVCIAFPIASIFSLGPLLDEPEDFLMIVKDVKNLFGHDWHPQFKPEQARFPNLIGAPFVIALSHDSLIPLRLLFFLFHLMYVYLSYRLVRRVFSSELPALSYAVLLLTSCFLAGNSIFALTAADTLYCLLHLATLCFFFDLCERATRPGGSLGIGPVIVCGGLCIASKLIGVLLCAALATALLLVKPLRNARLQIAQPLRVLNLHGVVFVALLCALNAWPFLPAVHYLCFGIVATYYLAAFGRWMYLEHLCVGPSREVSASSILLSCSLSIAVIAVIFSPNYSHFRSTLGGLGQESDFASLDKEVPESVDVSKPNLLNAFGLSSVGRAFHEPSLFLGPRLLFRKFGIVSSCLLLIPLFYFLCMRRTGESSLRLFVHILCVVLLIHLVVVWFGPYRYSRHLLAIFPFLYLPFVWFVNEARLAKRALLILVAFTCVTVVVIDNSVRYLTWFPYAHLDGLEQEPDIEPVQLTYEAIPLTCEIGERLRTADQKRANIRIGLAVNQWRWRNHWVAEAAGYFCNKIYSKEGLEFVAVEKDSYASVDYVITSRLYDRGAEEPFLARGVPPVVTLTLKGLVIERIWKAT